jgi:hypothetical protein
MASQHTPKTTEKRTATREAVERRRASLLQAMRRDVQILRRSIHGKDAQRVK